MIRVIKILIFVISVRSSAKNMLFPSFWYMVTPTTNKLENNTTKKIFLGRIAQVDGN